MEVSTVPFQQYAPFFKPEELDTLTAAFEATWQELSASGLDLSSEDNIALLNRKLAQRILVSATAGGVRDVETFERAVFAEPSLAASAPAVSKPLPRKQLEAPTQRKGLLEFQSEEGSALSSLETKRGAIPCLQALRRT